MTPFSELRVVEIEGSIAGAYCAKLFADDGAQVVVCGRSDLTEAQRLYLHHGKDLRGAIDDIALGAADVIIESSSTLPLSPLDPEPASDAVRVRISPYGSSGPFAAWRGTDATMFAHSGHLHLTGDPDREPLSAPPNLPAQASGLFAFIGTMGALFDRTRFGKVNVVEIATHEVMVALHQLLLMRYQLGKDILCRMGNRYTGQGQPNGMYECSDGWVAISAPTDEQVEMICAITGGDHLLENPLISSPMDFQTYPEVLDEHLVPWLRARPMAEVADFFQSARIPTAPATPMLGLLDDVHLKERDFWRSIDGVMVPGRPFTFTSPQGPGPRSMSLAGDPDQSGSEPLSGVRVLDLTKVWAGPLAARLLAELGAEVIQVEPPWGRGPKEIPESLVQAMRLFPDNEPGEQPWNRNGHLIKYGLHKKSVALDLTQADGVDAFERLVSNSDVVIENFSSRVMPQLGLDEHRLHEINTDLIYMTMPGYGRSGPSENWVAYGTTVDSHAGLSHLIGYPGQVPWKCGTAWPDPIAGLHAVSAILIGLWRRPEHGGVTIEGAQFEATLTLTADALVSAQLGGVEPPVLGNRHPTFAPQGVYRCAGPDRWIALSVVDDDGWRHLCAAAELPDGWSEMTIEARRRHHDEIDQAIDAWTASRDQNELAARLQALGIAAAPSLDAPGVLADAHLAARDALVTIEQPLVGRFVTPRMPVHFSERSQRPPLRTAALLGEHNEEVLGSIGGLDGADILRLTEAGIVATEPPL